MIPLETRDFFPLGLEVRPDLIAVAMDLGESQLGVLIAASRAYRSSDSSPDRYRNRAESFADEVAPRGAPLRLRQARIAARSKVVLP